MLKLVGLVSSACSLASFIIIFSGFVLSKEAVTHVFYAIIRCRHSSTPNPQCSWFRCRPCCRLHRSATLASNTPRSLSFGWSLPPYYTTSDPLFISHQIQNHLKLINFLMFSGINTKVKIHYTLSPLLPVTGQLPVELPSRISDKVLYFLQVAILGGCLLSSEQSTAGDGL